MEQVLNLFPCPVFSVLGFSTSEKYFAISSAITNWPIILK